MLTIHSFIETPAGRVSAETFAGPVENERYLEGTLTLHVDDRPILPADHVDYIDQLWAYLIDGLEEVVAGREFSTYYPDTPIEVTLRPHGSKVTIAVDRKKSTAEATVELAELRATMVAAATTFLQRMRAFMPGHEAWIAGTLQRLAALA